MTTLLFVFPHTLRGEPEIGVQLEPHGSIKVGRVCHLSVDVSWKKEEGDFLFQNPQLLLDRFTVEESGESNEAFQKNGEAWKRKKFLFSLKAFQPGQGKIRPFQLNYLDPATQQGGSFEIQGWDIKIVPDRSQFYRGVGLALGVFLSSGLLGKWLVDRRFAQKRRKEENREISLEKRYLIGLSAYESQDLTREQVLETGKLFSGYLHDKYQLSILPGTRQQILGQMKDKVLPSELKNLEKIFDTMEQFRYTPNQGSTEEWRDLYQEIVSYVESKKIISLP